MVAEKGTKDHILVSDYKEYMTKTMGFPPLDEEVEFFVKFSGKKSGDDK